MSCMGLPYVQQPMPVFFFLLHLSLMVPLFGEDSVEMFIIAKHLLWELTALCTYDVTARTVYSLHVYPSSHQAAI